MSNYDLYEGVHVRRQVVKIVIRTHFSLILSLWGVPITAHIILVFNHKNPFHLKAAADYKLETRA